MARATNFGIWSLNLQWDLKLENCGDENDHAERDEDMGAASPR